MTKVGVAEGFDNIKNLDDVAISLTETKASILLRLEDNFDRKEHIVLNDEKRGKLDNAKLSQYDYSSFDGNLQFLAREQSKQIVEDREQIKRIVVESWAETILKTGTGGNPRPVGGGRPDAGGDFV